MRIIQKHHTPSPGPAYIQNVVRSLSNGFCLARIVIDIICHVSFRNARVRAANNMRFECTGYRIRPGSRVKTIKRSDVAARELKTTTNPRNQLIYHSVSFRVDRLCRCTRNVF